MEDGSFYNEGLVAAACGLASESNPYPDGSGFRENWRLGFLSYGFDRGLGGVSVGAVRTCAYLQRREAPLSLCPWAWCEIYGVADD